MRMGPSEKKRITRAVSNPSVNVSLPFRPPYVMRQVLYYRCVAWRPHMVVL